MTAVAVTRAATATIAALFTSMISATTIVTQVTYPAHPTLNHQILLMTRDLYIFAIASTVAIYLK
jgi:hypothetical protein